MSRWKIAAAVLAAGAGLVLALLLGGRSEGLALLAYVLFVAGVVLAVLARRLPEVLPPAVPFERLLPVTPRPEQQVGQFEMIRSGLTAAGWNDAELRYRLAPMVREIAAARLSRSHGIDLDRQPEQAQALIGGGQLWELISPGEPLAGRRGGWSRQDLATLLDELEAI